MSSEPKLPQNIESFHFVNQAPLKTEGDKGNAALKSLPLGKVSEKEMMPWLRTH